MAAGQKTPAKRAATKGPKPGYEMTDEHKARLAEGREQARIVKAYLEALQNAPKRAPNLEAIRAELITVIEENEATSDPMEKLKLAARKAMLSTQLVSVVNGDIPTLEAEFVKVAKDYGDRNGIPGDAWRDVGVPVKVLRTAGIAVTPVKRGEKSDLVTA